MAADWWIDYPWRMIQTNLREIDMRDIDADQYVTDLQSFAATVAMINTSGIIASYETDLPFHYQSPYLEAHDLETIIEACHDADIRVIARTDFSKVRRPIYEQHPEWAYRSADGEIMAYNGDVSCCINGDYQQEYVFDIIAETVDRLDIDGMFFNMAGYRTRDYSGNYYGYCHCPNCKREFHERYDRELPTTADRDDPAYRDYRAFQAETIAEYEARLNDFITDLDDGLCIANHLDSERGFVRRESNTAIDRPLPRWQYDASATTKWIVSTYPEMVASNTTVDFIDFPYRHVAVSPHEQELRLLQNLANGGSLDYYLIGRIDDHEDQSGFPGVTRVFQFHAEHESLYRDLRPDASTLLLAGGDRAAFRGWYRTLVESHVLFETMQGSAAADRDWSGYDTVIVPTYVSMTDELAGAIDDFVAAGGTLVASGRTSFRTDRLDQRDRPAIDALGIDAVSLVREDMTSSYIRLEDIPELPRCADRELVYLEGPYVYAEYATDVSGHGRLIPPHDFGPPERCYYDTVTDHPGVTTRSYGDGDVVYLPWEPGPTFYEQGHPNTGDFLADVLEQLAGVTPINIDAPSQVEVTRLTDGDRDVVHFINGSGHFGNTFHEPVPIHDVSVTVSRDREPGRVEALVADTTCPVDEVQGTFTITIPRIDRFEALLID